MASGFPTARHRKLGPAPIASFEDLSDDVENVRQGEHARMPGIVEVTTPVASGSSLKTPNTPRIDISRASSSSQHEDSNNSRESTPEKELLAGADPPPGCKLTLGYKEDADDLRSSTEELDLHDPVHEQDLRRELKRSRRRPKDHDGTQSEYGGSMRIRDRERKDSNCSEIILLNISGRSSRLSSVGSQGSGVSGALSVASAASSRSPSPHKCLLETSFCGSVSTLANTLVEPSKPETDDLAKILLQREADPTKVLIPECARVPYLSYLRPDQLEMQRAREERKEIFKREVEITKKVLKRVNIEVPIIKLPPGDSQDVQKPATLDITDNRRKSTNEDSYYISLTEDISTPPHLHRHRKSREVEGSRTPSPPVSRKSSFASIFKSKTDGSVQNLDSPPARGRRSLTTKIKSTAESLHGRSKSREPAGTPDKSSNLKKDSKNKGVFSSTLSLFKKRERKKSGSDSTDTRSEHQEATTREMDGIGRVEFTFNNTERRKDDSIFISLHADDRNYEEALPSESVSIPLETTTPVLDDNDISVSRPGNIVTEASIEHRASIPPKGERKGSRPSSGESHLPESHSKESHLSRSSSKDSKLIDGGDDAKEAQLPPMSSSSSRDSICKKPDIVKPKRRSKERPSSGKQDQAEATTPEVQPPKTESNGRSQELREEKQVSVMSVNTDESLSSLAQPQLEPVQQGLTKAPSVTSDLDHNSSESEKDSEVDFERTLRNQIENVAEELPDEVKGLCYEESFEEDFPYVPTTLPMEKSVVVPILPVKQRLQEVRTTPIERPRSTTPINPTLLDEFIMHTSSEERRVQKMKISLPREESFKLKSPHRHVVNSFSEFAGRVSGEAFKKGATNLVKSPSPPPPPLPPRAPTARPSNWINFEEIPEKRRAPKRIQTIPRACEDPKVGYSYVQPEECRCECHEESRRVYTVRGMTTFHPRAPSNCGGNERACNGAHCSNLGLSGDRRSVISDSSLEYSLGAEYSSGHQRISSASKPFSMDLDVSSNRSSIISQEETEDAHQ